jgi:hypothetical protein
MYILNVYFPDRMIYRGYTDKHGVRNSDTVGNRLQAMVLRTVECNRKGEIVSCCGTSVEGELRDR